MKPFAAMLAAVLCTLCPGSARAELATFVLDPAASRLTVSGTLVGQPFIAQNPGSLTTGYTGTLFADIVDGGFTLSSDVPNAVNQPLPQRPGHNTVAAEPANYGLLGTGPAVDTLFGAIQGMDLSISGPTSPPLPLTGGTFDATAVGVYINGGSLYFSQGPLSNYVDLHGTGAPNTATTPGTLTTAGDVQTLTLPIRITGTRDVRTPGDTVLLFEGQMVGTRVVPEPAAGLLAVLGAAGMLRRRRTA